MKPALRWPILGVLVAIAATTAMDANGLLDFSALPLIPLTFLFWYLQRLPRQSVGFAWGKWHHYGLALLYPVVVLGLVAAISAAAGATDLSHTNWQKTWLNLALLTGTTVIVAIITEEGFFRGWLFGSLERAGLGDTGILVWSSIAFALWHISAVTFASDYALPVAQIPLFIVNAAVIGAIWGLLRRISGSVIVSSVSHGLWNGGAYVFFGFGIKSGALGITETAIFGPEVGILGLALNLIFAAALWRWQFATDSPSPRAPRSQT